MDGIDMTLLTDSIRKAGTLIVPVTVCKDVIVDGYRRWLACRALGWTEIDTHEVEGNPDELRVIAQTRQTVFGPAEKKAFVGDYLTKNREATAAGIAQTFQWTPGEVEQLVGVEYLIPEFHGAYADRSLDLASVWQVSRCRDIGQLQLWDEAGTEDIYDRACALHREVRTARRRSMVSRPRGKGFNAILAEYKKPTEAGIVLIKAEAVTAMDGWNACLDWIVNASKG
jgi:hypothetical protein